MWATRITSSSWKTSVTILIDTNKGAETDISSYRPIGLHAIQVVDTPRHQHPLQVRWSTLPAQHHTSKLPKPKRHHTPALKCHHEPWGCLALWKWHLCLNRWFYLSFQRHRPWQNSLDYVWPWLPSWCNWYCLKPLWRCHHTGQTTLWVKHPENTSWKR